MSTINAVATKFAIGDVVFRSGVQTARRRHPCPDCLDSGSWSARSPAGNEYNFPCPRCAANYRSNDDLSLDYTVHAPSVERLTIGSVRTDTAADRPISYMCVETGVGSGNIYYEEELHASEEAALRAAEVKAAVLDGSVEWVVNLFNRSLSVSDYQLENAALKVARDEAFRGRRILSGLSGLFHKIQEASSLEDAQEAADDYQRFEWDDDKKQAGLAEAPATLAAAEAR